MTEKELMLTSILKCTRTDLYSGAVSLTPVQEQQLKVMRARRDEGEPLQYILGECSFMGLTLAVDKRVLVPRPETELLVEAVIKAVLGFGSRSVKILDLGTGSGNIAISLAKNIPESFVVAVDVSEDALQLARENAARHNVSDKIEFIHDDMINFFNMAVPQFDIIVSNPPYIVNTEISQLPQDVQQEPDIALNGGLDGLEYYRAIIGKGMNHLKKGGLLFCEIGDGQKEALTDLVQQHAEYVRFSFLKDYVNTDRIIIVQTRNSRLEATSSV